MHVQTHKLCIFYWCTGAWWHHLELWCCTGRAAGFCAGCGTCIHGDEHAARSRQGTCNAFALLVAYLCYLLSDLLCILSRKQYRKYSSTMYVCIYPQLPTVFMCTQLWSYAWIQWSVVAVYVGCVQIGNSGTRSALSERSPEVRNKLQELHSNVYTQNTHRIVIPKIADFPGFLIEWRLSFIVIVAVWVKVVMPLVHCMYLPNSCSWI